MTVRKRTKGMMNAVTINPIFRELALVTGNWLYSEWDSAPVLANQLLKTDFLKSTLGCRIADSTYYSDSLIQFFNLPQSAPIPTALTLCAVND
jgi:hypothetical protein